MRSRRPLNQSPHDFFYERFNSVRDVYTLFYRDAQQEPLADRPVIPSYGVESTSAMSCEPVRRRSQRPQHCQGKLAPSDVQAFRRLAPDLQHRRRVRDRRPCAPPSSARSDRCRSFLEAEVRGYRSCFLSRADYSNLSQCDTLDGSASAALCARRD